MFHGGGGSRGMGVPGGMGVQGEYEFQGGGGWVFQGICVLGDGV